MRHIVLLCLVMVQAERYWISLPDAYSGGGGHCNQLEQMLGAVQCSIKEESPQSSMILPDFRADRPAPGRFLKFEDVYEINSLKEVARLATWREALRDCEHAVKIVGPKENISSYARNAPWVFRTQWCRDCDSKCLLGTKSILRYRACPSQPDRRHAFKSNRLCKGRKSKYCQNGFDWSATLNGSRHFKGLIDPDRISTHLDACARRALSRLNSNELKAATFLEALKPVASLLQAIHNFPIKKYDAVHVRLGDFQRLCTSATSRTAKFCPPSAEVLRRGIFDTLATAKRKPLLLLSDEPHLVFEALGSSPSFIFQLQESLLTEKNSTALLNMIRAEPLYSLILEIELAARADTFIGLACSTVSQLIIKRRIAKAFLHGHYDTHDRGGPPLVDPTTTNTKAFSARFFLWP